MAVGSNNRGLVTQQEMFGGSWTQSKLKLLSDYLREYRKIFDRNVRARFFEVSYVDAFAGTGVIPRRQSEFKSFFPGLEKLEEEFRKGSVKRALEIEPPFHHYVLIEKNKQKCKELELLKKQFTDRQIKIINDDANVALLRWCGELDTGGERAVVFLDPFGASVQWRVIQALAATKAVDLWILFPYSAINRLLTSKRKPPKAWADRLTSVFGTTSWEQTFYTSTRWQSLLDPKKPVEIIHKTADYKDITDFFVARLRGEFAAVAEPGFLRNSRGLLFVLFFAAGNERGADAGLKIANHLLRKLNQSF
jgi:three-Cys-motif partner protein